MDALQNEINDLKQFAVDLKTDRAAQKEKEKRESWTKYVSLTMVCLAVLTAIATQKGGGFTTQTLRNMTEATLKQAQASDQWTFYQAKSIKQNLYEVSRDQLQAGSANGNGSSSKAIDGMTARIERYDKEKADIKVGAEKLEQERDAARKLADSAAAHSKSMGMAISYFQVAIAIGGICLVVKKKPLWFVSMAIGIYAVWQMYLVLQTPL